MKSWFNRSAPIAAWLVLLIGLTANLATAHQNNNAPGIELATPMIGGYDPVAYFKAGKPVRGSGYHTETYKGGTYLFANAENRKAFAAQPEKYAPQYGGYCAYGVAVGKKFYSDPNRWKIVDGKLYLNLDQGIQEKWNEDIRGNILKADSNWTRIESKAPSEL